MKTFTLILAMALFSASAGAQSALFKGYEAIGNEISTRVLPDGSVLGMANYLPDAGLVKLLGGWESAGSEHAFQNGVPNSVSMLVWYIGLTGVAEAISGDCTQAGALKMNPGFTAVLERTCRWPDAAAQTEDAMMDFWISLMGYQAPEEEYTAWRDFFLSSTYRTRPATETVRAMALAIFMNPHFLLAH